MLHNIWSHKMSKSVKFDLVKNQNHHPNQYTDFLATGENRRTISEEFFTLTVVGVHCILDYLEVISLELSHKFYDHIQRLLEYVKEHPGLKLYIYLWWMVVCHFVDGLEQTVIELKINETVNLSYNGVEQEEIKLLMTEELMTLLKEYSILLLEIADDQSITLKGFDENWK